MARSYVPYPEKHKWPKGFGSLCPRDMPEALPSALLQDAVRVPGVGENKLWMATGRWCFCAHRTTTPSREDVWHGFPVIGGEVDERVWNALRRAAILDARSVRRLRRQRALPERWP